MKYCLSLMVGAGFYLSGISFTGAQTLEEAIRQTLDGSPNVLVQSAGRQAQENLLRQAKAGFFPTLDIAAGYGIEDSKNSSTQNFSGNDVSLNRREVSATLSQNLFNGFATVAEVKRNQALVNAAGFDVHQTSEAVALEVVEAYLEVLRRQQLVALAKENVAVHERIATKMAQSAKQGAHRGVDARQAEGRTALAFSLLLQAQGDLQDANARFIQIVGVAPDNLVLPAAISGGLPATLDVALQGAHEHPAILSARKAVRAAREDVKVVLGTYYPEISLDFAASDNNNLDGVRGDNDDILAMVRMRYNLFRGGADKAQVAERRERVIEALETLRQVQREISEDARLSWNALTTAQARLKYQTLHRESSRDVHEAYKQAFKIGKRTLLDVLDVRNELFNAQSTEVNGRLTVAFAHYRIYAAMGTLLGRMQISLPNTATTRTYQGLFD